MRRPGEGVRGRAPAALDVAGAAGVGGAAHPDPRFFNPVPASGGRRADAPPRAIIDDCGGLADIELCDDGEGRQPGLPH